MTSGVPNLLERLSHADLIGVVRDSIGEVGRLWAENEKVNFALTQLNAIREDIFGNEIDPHEVRAKVKAMLAGLPTDDETMGAVLHEAREIEVVDRADWACSRPDCIA
jgi:hypothetical protein